MATSTATAERAKPRLGVFKLASCDGCQRSLLDLEDELLAIVGAVDIVHFPEASSAMNPHGPFDVTLVDIADREINVIATNGDHILGGKDWDDRLIEHVAQAFIEKHGLDPRDDLASYHDLRAKCVSAKISLTRRPKVNVFHDYGSKVLRLAVTRETFEELTKDLLDRADRAMYDDKARSRSARSVART